MSERRYFPELTVARGLIALLVIAGHAFPDGSRAMSDALAKGAHDFIYAFHMAAFIFISGFVASPKLRSEFQWGREAARRFRRLMVPYLCWTAVLLAPRLAMAALGRADFAWADAWKLLAGISHLGWLWYLWTLFAIATLFLAWFRWRGDIGVPALACLAALSVATQLFLPDVPLTRVAKYAFFYGLGAWAHPRADALFRLIDHPLTPALGAAVPLVGLLFPLPCALEGCAGTAMLLHVARRIAARPGRAREFWNAVGQSSYELYLLGYYVQTPIRVLLARLIPSLYWLQVLLDAALGFGGGLALCRLAARAPAWFRRWFLGQNGR